MASPLNDDNVKLEVLRYWQDNLKQSQISQLTGLPKSTINDFITKKSYTKWWQEYGERPVAAGNMAALHEDIDVLGEGVYIFVSAQNNTYVHNKFMDSLEVLAVERNAQILCGTFTYNTSGFQNIQKGTDSEEVWYDPRIKKYILDKPVMVCDDLMWCGELNILPTAVNPLSGLHSYTRGASGVVPHAKLQLESIPTHKSLPAKIMYTTGAVTKRNYIQKKAGQKAEFHHAFSALIVEVDNEGDFFVRQLNAETSTGCFYDLDKYYTPSGVYDSNYVEAINWGDIHVEKMDKVVYDISFGKNGILDTLRPKYQFIHDVFDAYYRNHHHIKNAHKMFELHIKGKESVRSEVSAVGEFLQNVNRDYCQSVVVNSNHDRALDRWLNEADYKHDYINSVFFLELQLLRYKGIVSGNNIVLLEEAISKILGYDITDTKFLAIDEQFVVCDQDGNGVECGMHGDLGASGSRGSAMGFARLSSRVNIGHSHTAKIFDGVYQTGHCMDIDKVDYAKGPSSWSHSHIITYPNGKRSMITLKNGKWKSS